MIISASRRTDIPAFYGSWFMDQINRGFVQVVNPMNSSQVSTISLLPSEVDIIVFWTKDPQSLLPKLEELLKSGYECCFQFTLTPYGKNIEPGLDSKRNVIDRFKQLSKMIGTDRVLWRYDPIIFTQTLTPGWHIEQFLLLAEELDGFTKRCTISFLDLYKKIERDMMKIVPLSYTDFSLIEFSSRLSEIAHFSHMEIVSCATELDLSSAGISHGSCIDGNLIESLTGKRITKAKDRGQRSNCGCVKSRDIGTYGTCRHGCLYCYAR
jgi:hypothetical protein